VPQGQVSFGDIARTPVIYAVAIALVLMGTGTRLPTPVDDAFTILGGLAIPLMLLTLGHGHEVAETRLFTSLRYSPAQWRSLTTMNAIERLHEEFKR
jgi:hypothetical protein